MFAKHTEIVQLLLLYCIVIQSCVLCDVGSTLNQSNARSEIPEKAMRHAEDYPPKSWSLLKDSNLSPLLRGSFVKRPPIANIIFPTRLEGQSSLSAKEGVNKIDGIKTRYIHNIVNKDLQQEIYNIKSNNGDWKLNHVKVSSTTDKSNQLLKESNSNFLGDLLTIFSTLFQRS